MFRNLALAVVVALALSCSAGADVLVYDGRSATELVAVGQAHSRLYAKRSFFELKMAGAGLEHSVKVVGAMP